MNNSRQNAETLIKYYDLLTDDKTNTIDAQTLGYLADLVNAVQGIESAEALDAAALEALRILDARGDRGGFNIMISWAAGTTVVDKGEQRRFKTVNYFAILSEVPDVKLTGAEIEAVAEAYTETLNTFDAQWPEPAITWSACGGLYLGSDVMRLGIGAQRDLARGLWGKGKPVVAHNMAPAIEPYLAQVGAINVELSDTQMGSLFKLFKRTEDDPEFCEALFGRIWPAMLDSHITLPDGVDIGMPMLDALSISMECLGLHIRKASEIILETGTVTISGNEERLAFSSAGTPVFDIDLPEALVALVGKDGIAAMAGGVMEDLSEMSEQLEQDGKVAAVKSKPTLH